MLNCRRGESNKQGWVGVPEKYLKMRLYHKMRGEGGYDNKIEGEGAMIFIFLLLPEMVNTLIFLLELM